MGSTTHLDSPEAIAAYASSFRGWRSGIDRSRYSATLRGARGMTQLAKDAE